MGLANGRGGLRLAELALAAGHISIRDPAPHHTGLDLLKVVCLGRDFGLQEADVSLISSLLLGEQRREEDRKHTIEIRVMGWTLILYLFNFRRYIVQYLDESTKPAHTS